MPYQGEHLLPGQLGHFLILLSFVASIVATIAYYKATVYYSSAPLRMTVGNSWKRLARAAFILQTLCVIGVFAILYYIISNHLFEYKYAWQHSSKALQIEYLLSCFWEGQEGSFMLWSFWHCVVGVILICKAKKWETSVMTVVSFAQIILATMLLGLYFFDIKVGSSPFVLLRNELQAPIFSQPNYLQFIKDGNGLNALLQNYWMVIHPPILFLGFASTLIPFAYTIAGLWKGDYKTSANSALPWALFSAAILGTGVMMGAAWAYESLNFGGYWAWDPVENASLVPWLILVAGIHTNLIYKHSGYSLRATYFFYILAFILILYSTFLTRSGILGDTSVHAFTDLGMNVQLILFVLIFLIPSLLLFIKKYKQIPTIHKEENVYSREFLMFVGSLVLCISALLIIGATSLPVINKIINTKFALGEDALFAYNRIQIWFAILLGLLTAITQYFKYKNTSKKFIWKKIALPTILTLVITTCISIWGNINYNTYGLGFLGAIHVAIAASVYAVIANAAYIFTGVKGKIKKAGASIAHIGFGLLLFGILISSSKKTVLSLNTTGFSPLEKQGKENALENITLVKGIHTDMGKYDVTYSKDTLNPTDRKRYYEIKFKPKNGEVPFNLYPDVIENNKGQEGMTPNPDAKHYWNKDIYTYLTYLTNPDKTKDTTSFRNVLLKPGDSLFYSNGFIIFKNITINPSNEKYHFGANDTALMANITVQAKDGRLYKANPALQLIRDKVILYNDTVTAQSLVLRLNKVSDPKNGSIELGIKESNAILDYLTLKVYEFPFIILVWAGVIIMVIGFVISIVQKIDS